MDLVQELKRRGLVLLKILATGVPDVPDFGMAGWEFRQLWQLWQFL